MEDQADSGSSNSQSTGKFTERIRQINPGSAEVKAFL